MGLGTFFSRNDAHPPRFAEGRVGYAVGDIHGRADLLAGMLELLEDRAASDARANGPPIVVFLGDYVDRGPDSAVVVEMLLSGRPEGFERRFLMGNHEAAMLAFLQDPMGHRDWIGYGGLETMQDYGVEQPPSAGATDDELRAVAEVFRKEIPSTHMRFYEELEIGMTIGDYAFVHAGVDPDRPLTDQSPKDLMWIRDRFLEDKRRLEKIIVHGHTPVEVPYVDHRRICVDTGAYVSGRLTAARFEGQEVRFETVSDHVRAA